MTGDLGSAATVVAPSPIAGRGVFAAAAVPAGTPVGRHDQLNHCCDPNLGWSGDHLVALCDIAVGEELTYDYSTATTDPAFLLRCHCPSWRCRQMVTGDDWR
ncbi:MAG: SET domain-containing protein, partial [Jatrophihabitans sp.]